MKLTQVIAALVLAASGTAFAAQDHGHEIKPLQGGIVTVVKDIEYELVAKPDTLQLHLRDHGKKVDVSQASAKLTLLAGSDKQEVELKPAGDKLEARGSFKVAANTKALVVVSLAGKSSTARFVLK
ncbi:MAG: hypothetical protein Q8R49_05530 [Rhodoferax sp.]|nr:hypothetical protein [Rhodoferax sp.]